MSQPNSGFGAVTLMLGGSCRCARASTVLINAAIPAAWPRWPMFDFTEATAQKPVRSGSRLTARYASTRPASSMGSPTRVPVPCAST